MNSDPIVGLDGKPFKDFEQAAALRDLLARESGHAYRVDRPADGEGFLVCRIGSANRGAGRAPDTASDVDETGVSTDLAPLVLRPALRTTLPLHSPVLLLGAILASNPVAILAIALEALDIGSLPRGLDPGWLIAGARGIGFLLLLSTAGAFIPWLSHRYRVSAEGVSMQRGIVSRDTVQIRFRDIRSIGLRQGVIERLLNVGTVEFAAAGTDAVDVAFAGIARPADVKAFVQERMRGRR